MESLQQIKTRIKGVKNINQITKAMELVAATKMRKSQEIALASRPYALAALDFLGTLTRLDTIVLPPLLEARPVQRSLFVLVTSDKGLAGSFNANVIREFEKFVRREAIDLRDPRYVFIAIGQKARGYLERHTRLSPSGGNLAASFTRVGDYTTLDQVEPIAQELVRGFLEKQWDEVRIWSTNFKTALRQVAMERKVLPIDYESLKRTAEEILPDKGSVRQAVEAKQVSFFGGTAHDLKEYLIEPAPAVILSELAEHLVRMQVYHVVLEANASEHAARRVAMKSASDNAGDLGHTLTLLYNKSRQAAITKEIIEITAGAESLK